MNRFALFVGFLGAVVLQSCDLEERAHPVPTERKATQHSSDEKDEFEEREERQKWIDLLHKAEPGLDWRKQDQLTRINRLQAKTMRSAETASELVTIANGSISGAWKERGSSNQSGRVMYADYLRSDQKIYVASAGGTIFKGNKDGTGWQPLNDHFNLGNIDYFAVLQETGAQRLFVAAGKFCYYSDDDGQTWETSIGLNNVQSWGDIKKGAVLDEDNERIYLLLQEWDYQNWGEIMSVYTSTDRGTSFSKLFSVRTDNTVEPDLQDLWAHRYEGNVMYYLQGNTVMQWHPSKGLDTLGTVVASPSSYGLITGTYVGTDTILYAALDADIYRSDDNGKKWTKGDFVDRNPFRRNSFAASLTDRWAVAFGGVDCARSFDGFSTFEEVNRWWEYYGQEADHLHADIPAIVPFKDETNQYQTFICTDGGLYISNDDLQTVNNLSLHGLNCSQYYDVYTLRNNLEYINAGSQDQGFQLSSVDSADVLGFDQLISGDYAHIVSGDSGISLWFNYPGFSAYKSDATSSTAYSASGDYNNRNHYWLPPFSEHPSDPKRAFMAGELPDGSGAYIYELEASEITGEVDFSLSSANLNSVIPNAEISAFCYSPFDADYWFALTNTGEMVYSADGRTTWNSGGLNSGPEPHYFHGACIYASKASFGRLFAAGSGYSNPGIWVSEDHGATWEPIDQGLPPTLTLMITGTKDDSLIFAATEVGPYVFTAIDSTWHLMTAGSAPDQRYWSVEWLEEVNTVRFGTFGRGVWDFSMEVPSDTSASVVERSTDPTLNVYPNPFFKSISLEVSSPEPFEVEVFSLSGKKVAGKRINGQNNLIDLGNLPSGMYFIHATIADKSHVRRVLKL